ncbi:MAG: MFS transporter [Ardenticatenaceae bacterium]|nr:MFS transporter [Anaerolineales bacterium]MCB8923342.1 MFS transporter [Ardenticatenaceae bacterium]MCB9004658.1 MFS transporter [Ardenticatenaceae bacterium]
MNSSPNLTQFEAETQRYYQRNFLAGLVHGVFFQASAALGSIHTVLPAFVALLTPSTLAVGLMAAVQGVGEVVPQMFTAYLIEDRPRKKPYLLWIITTRWVSWAVLAYLTFAFGTTRPMLVLTVLITLFTIFSIAGGMGTVVYADVFSKAIPAQRRGRFTGLRQLVGYALAIGAGYVVKWVLDDPVRFPYPTNYAFIFLLSALALLVAFSGFAGIKEPVYPVQRTSQSLRGMLQRALFLARVNPNFRRLLGARALTTAVLAIAPFYVVYARTELVVDAGMVGVYLSAQMAGGALSNLLWGWLADRFGNRAVIVGTAVSGALSPLFALLAPMNTLFFLPVFAFLGATTSGMRLGYSNFILEMASVELRPTCVALQNTLLTPVSLLPLFVGGLVLIMSYPVMLSIGAVLMLLNIWVAYRLLDPRHGAEGACLGVE